MKNREILEQELKFVYENKIRNNKKNRKEMMDKIKEEFTNRNILSTKAVGMLNGSIPMENVSDQLLFILAKAVYSATASCAIELSKYFFEDEMKILDRYREKSQEEKDTLVIDRVIESRYNTYKSFLTYMTYQQIRDLYSQGRITYNPNAQRALLTSIYKDAEIGEIDLNNASIKEIKKAMQEGKYIPTMITFNMLKKTEEETKYYYDKNNLKLVIEKDVEIDVTDGYHRSVSVIEAICEMPDLEGELEVSITNYELDIAGLYVVQESKRNVIKPSQLAKLNVEKRESVVVNNLNNRTRKNEMYKKIATDEMAIKRNLAYVKFDTLVEAVKRSFALKAEREIEPVSRYLIEFYNEVIGINIEYFSKDNLTNSKLKSYIVHKNIFIFYTLLAGKLYEKDSWKEKLEAVLKNIDFNKNNSMWINRFRIEQVSSATYKGFEKYVDELVKEI